MREMLRRLLRKRRRPANDPPSPSPASSADEMYARLSDVDYAYTKREDDNTN